MLIMQPVTTKVQCRLHAAAKWILRVSRMWSTPIQVRQLPLIQKNIRELKLTFPNPQLYLI
jgi:hypothetical protein